MGPEALVKTCAVHALDEAVRLVAGLEVAKHLRGSRAAAARSF
jgi:hypothetical protein